MGPGFLIQQVIEAFIGVITFLGNALVLYVLLRHKPLRTVTNYLIASLAMADLLVGVIGIPCVIINNFGLPTNFYGCLMMSCTIVTFTQISIFSLLAIALERFLAVRHPVTYRNHVERRGVGLTVATCWILGTLVGVVPMFGWHIPQQEPVQCAFTQVISMEYMVYFNFFGFVLTPLVLIFIIYGYVFYAVRSRAHRSSFTDSIYSTFASPTRLEESVPKRCHHTIAKQRRRFMQESKAAKMIFVITVLFAMCWLPVHIMNTVTLFCHKTSQPGLKVGIFLTHINSAINPLLYAHNNDSFSEAFKQTIGLKKERVDALEMGSNPASCP